MHTKTHRDSYTHSAAPRAVVAEVIKPDKSTTTAGAARGDAARIDELEWLAHLMDTAFEVPGLGFRFGLDALIGLIPGFGDTIAGLVSLYIVAAASRYGLPRATLARMGANVAVDWLIGSIPIAGDLFDVAWKANRSNVAILRRHLDEVGSGRRRARYADWLFVAGLLLALFLLLVGIVTCMVLAFRGLWRLIG